MTGREDSTVAAYLLKKQGYNCIGVSIILVEGEEVTSMDEGPFSSCHISNVAQVKEICDKLEIPFYAVDAKDRFQAEVIDPTIAYCLSGGRYSPCVNCNRLKIQVLFEKAKILNATKVAMGHYCKISHNPRTGISKLLIGNDLENDQSYQLTRLDGTELSELIFPLADMRRVDVEKIVKSIELNAKPSKKNNEICFSNHYHFSRYLERKIAEELRGNGGIHKYSDGAFITEHAGIHNYWIGQNRVKGSGPTLVDDELVVAQIDQAKKIVYLAYPHEIKYSCISLGPFWESGLKTDVSRPIFAWIKLDINEERIPCSMFFKNNNTVLIEYKKVRNELVVMGQTVVLYSGKSKGDKVIGCGLVKQSEVFHPIDRIMMAISQRGERPGAGTGEEEKNQEGEGEGEGEGEEKGIPSRSIDFQF